MVKISEYPVKTVFHDDDLLDFSNTEDSGLTYNESQRVKWLELIAALNLVIENFATEDLTLPKNRIHNLNSFELAFMNGSTGFGTPTPHISSIVQLSSTSQGFLTPRMTEEQRDLIATPLEGLEIYNLTTSKKNFFNGSTWEQITSV